MVCRRRRVWRSSQPTDLDLSVGTLTWGIRQVAGFGHAHRMFAENFLTVCKSCIHTCRHSRRMQLPGLLTAINSGESRNTSLRWFKSSPLASWSLVVLLSIIALVLILPGVDLPDTAFRNNSSPLAIRSLSQQVPRANANVGLFRLSFQSLCSSTRGCMVREMRVRHPEGLPIEHKSLRC